MSASPLLVTGFPGLRARALVRSVLAEEPQTEILALFHPGRRDDAEAAKNALADRERVRLVQGDPAAMDLGMSGPDYRELARSVRLVHHAYQVLDRGAPGDVATQVNVAGAREMIELARAAPHLSRVVHHSSVFVSGDRTGVVFERELAAGQTFRSPVEASLALAEKMLQSHPEVPLTVVRAGQIVGDSRTGEVDHLDGIYPLLVFLVSAPRGVSLPLPGRADTPVPLVPVDYVARAARVLGGNPEALGKTVQLVDAHPLRARRLLELAAKRFDKRVVAGLNAAAFGRALLGNPGMSLLVKNLREMSDLVTSNVVYDHRNAAVLLAGSGVVCPPLEGYLDILLDDVERRVRERSFGDTSREACRVAS